MTNQTNKPFKTWNQQLKILHDRGLDTSSDSKRHLEQIGYYSLINGYKWLFLEVNKSGEPVHPEHFKPDTKFDDIYNLYSFDFELRSILYRALLKYEAMLGAEVAYRFSEIYQEEHSYLAMDNFSRNQRDVSSVLRTISSLSSTITRYSGKHGDNAIKHYVNEHGHVPLWVLVNFLTFGDLNYFYGNCTNDIQLTIASDFGLIRKRSYPSRCMQGIVTVDTIKSVNHLVNMFRNAVAHGEITYSKKVFHSPGFRGVKGVLYTKQGLKLNPQAGIFELIIAMDAVLPKKNYARLRKDLLSLLGDYQGKFADDVFLEILNKMGFPSNYQDLI